MTLALAVLIAALGAGYFLEDRFQTIKAAADVQARAEVQRLTDGARIANLHRADVADLELAQARTAAELTEDIQALRLQNVTMELTAIYEREEANRAFPSDAARKQQLLAQMAAIVAALEK